MLSLNCRNIISGNAIKFSDKGYVMVAVAEQVCSGNDIRFIFTVSDTGTHYFTTNIPLNQYFVGIGMDATSVNQLFQPFLQHHKNIQKYGGSGLGLTIVKKLLEAMKGIKIEIPNTDINSCTGEIAVSSEKGVGTTFTFTVVLEACDEEPHTPSKAVLHTLPTVAMDPDVLVITDNDQTEVVVSLRKGKKQNMGLL